MNKVLQQSNPNWMVRGFWMKTEKERRGWNEGVSCRQSPLTRHGIYAYCFKNPWVNRTIITNNNESSVTSTFPITRFHKKVSYILEYNQRERQIISHCQGRKLMKFLTFKASISAKHLFSSFLPASTFMEKLSICEHNCTLN